MRLLLVGNPKTVFGFNRLAKMPSLNLSSLAANIDEGLCEIKIADLNVLNRNSQKIFQKILYDFRPDIVGFTAMSFQYQTALELAKITKQTLKNVSNVMGGVHVSSDLENILDSQDMNYIDYLISGEGEISFNSLLIALDKKSDFEGVPGISFKRNNKITINPKAELIPLEKIKTPDRNSRIFKKGFHVFGEPADVIETSRGCVYDCNYCTIRNIYGKTFRKYSVERILLDIEDAKRHGAKSIFFVDDNITLDGKRFMRMCKEIENAKLNMHFYVQASVNGINKVPELPEAMAKAGFKGVFLGIENMSDDALSYMEKDNQLKSADTIHAIRNLKKNKILVVGGFIFGYPDDTKEMMLQNYKFAVKSGINIPLFNILTPHLKTKIREELIKENMVTNLNDYSKYNHYAANVRTKHLSSEDLYQIRNKMDYRFISESKVKLELFKAFPRYFLKLIFFDMIFKESPRDLLLFIKHIFKKVK